MTGTLGALIAQSIGFLTAGERFGILGGLGGFLLLLEQGGFVILLLLGGGGSASPELT